MSKVELTKIALCGDDSLVIKAYQQIKQQYDDILIVSCAPMVTQWAISNELNIVFLSDITVDILDAQDLLIVLSSNHRFEWHKLASQITCPILRYFEQQTPYLDHTSPISKAIMEGQKIYGICFAQLLANKCYQLIESVSFECPLQETASSLKNKCDFAAIKYLKIILEKTGSLKDTFNKPLQQIPLRALGWEPPSGQITFNQTVSCIQKLLNALDYGYFYNPFTCPVIEIMPGHFYFVSKARTKQEQNNTLAPGTIIEITPNLIVQCDNGQLIIESLHECNTNKPILLSTFTSQHELEIGSQLPPPSISQQEFYTAWLNSQKFNERSLQENLSSSTPSPYFNSNIECQEPPVKQHLDSLKTRLIKLAEQMQVQPDLCFFVLSLIYCYLLEENSINFCINSAIKIPGSLKSFFTGQIPCQATFQQQATFKQLLTQFNSKLTSAQSMLLANSVCRRLGSDHEIDLCWLRGIAAIQLQTDELPTPVNFQGLIFRYTKQHCTLEFNSGYCSQDEKTFVVNQIAEHLNYLLQQIENQVDIPIQDLQILSESGENYLFSFNQQATIEDRPNLIIDLFKQNALKNPNHIALHYCSGKISYAQLDKLSDNIACYLQKHFSKNQTIAIILPRSLNFLIAVASIFKSGSTYVPVSPNTPLNRLQIILQDVNAAALICATEDKFNFDFLEILTVDELIKVAPKNAAPAIRHTLDDLAYIVYTSGSTGKPKGVPIKRHSLLNFVLWYQHALNINADSIVTMAASTGFDASVLEIWANLCANASIKIVTDEILLDPHQLLYWINQEKITHCFLTTAIVNLLLKIPGVEFKHPITILVGGDKLTTVKHPYPNLTLINVYGPTENTIFTTFFPIDYSQSKKRPPAIGKPLNDVELYVGKQRLKPIGIEGELLIGGENLFPGYINNEDETQRAFVNFKIGDTQKSLYRSGDLVRWLPSGDIDYIQRKNTQIKIRGFRVELSEIENIIRSHPTVKQAVVIANKSEQNDYILTAYLVEKKFEQLSVAELKAYIKEYLPSYMLPNIYYILDKLPLTINKKIDRKKLTRETDTAPQTTSSPQEKILGYIRTILVNPNITVESNLLDAGISSITAIYLAWKIEKLFQVRLAPANVFKHVSLAGLLKLVAHSEKTISTKTLTAKNIIEAPISLEQKPLHNYMLLHPSSTNYNITFYWQLAQKPDADQLENAINKIIEQQLALQVRFINEKQVVMPSRINIDWLEQQTDLKKTLTNLSNKPFKLDQELLLRASITQINGHYYLILTIHHLIFDGWSLNIFTQLLNQILHSKAPEPPKLDYITHAVYQHEKDNSIDQQKLEFWQALDMPHQLDFPYIRDAENNLTVPSIEIQIHSNKLEKLKLLARKHQTSLFTLLISSYALTLSHYTQQQNILIACTHFNRDNEALKNTLGYFVNLIPLIFSTHKNLNIKNYFKACNDKLSTYFENAIPFAQLSSEISDLSIETLFSLQLDGDTHIDFPSGTSSSARVFYTSYKYPLTMTAAIADDTLTLTLEFSPTLLSTPQAKGLITNYVHLLNTLSNLDDTTMICQLDYICPEELQHIKRFEQGPIQAIPEETLFMMFEKTALDNPNDICVQTNYERQTYKNLLKRANHFAQALLDQKISHGSKVVVLLAKQIDLVASFLGILKIGAIFIPLDIHFPTQRIAYIIEDTNADTVITNQENKDKLPKEIPVLLTEELTDQSDRKLNIKRIKATDPAYIIYTSGSTGKPKGVIVSQGTVINTLIFKCQTFNTNEKSRILSISTISFDLFICDVLSPLIAGATLILADRNVTLSGSKLTEAIKTFAITELSATPSLLNVLDPKQCDTIKTLAFVGEALGKSLVKRWDNGKRLLLNGYGPTETAIYATFSQCLPDRTVTIGSPIANNSIYILNKNQQRLALGTIGELYIAGTGVANGYLNKSQMTQKKFTQLASFSEQRCYRTGDLGRWNEQGEIEYIGRLDDQIKFHGFRIELEGINHIINEYPQITAAYTILVPVNNDKKLVSYYSANKIISEKELRQFLATRLPMYMLPNYLISLEKIPRTLNGKIDLSKFPLPSLAVNMQKPVEPLNDTENRLLTIWQKILLHKSISKNDNFFTIGGHSLLAIQLIDEIKGIFNKALLYQHLIVHNTIQTLAKFIDEPIQHTNSNWILLKQGDDSLPPIIFIHPLGGTVFWYLNYVHGIERHTVYAIQDPSIDGDVVFNSLNEIAIYYSYLINKHLPQGPYILAGASSGANIATEIINFLQKDNKQVLALLAFDSWQVFPEALRNKRILRSALEQQLQTMQDKFNYHRIADPEKWIKLQLERSTFIDTHISSMINVPFFLFKAESIMSIFENTSSEYNFWEEQCELPITVYTIPGDHETMHFPPNSEKLTESINDALNKIDNSDI